MPRLLSIAVSAPAKKASLGGDWRGGGIDQVYWEASNLTLFSKALHHFRSGVNQASQELSLMALGNVMTNIFQQQACVNQRDEMVAQFTRFQ
ncbi:MAG: hypothetical protein ACJASL_003020 [Paraglaciecola sp.]|jgi:hypothetical protein